MKLHASDAKTDDSFGHSVAISGDTAVIGAFQEATGGFETGAAYIFERDQGGANAWGQVTKLRASDPTPNALFGCSVAISGDTVIVGADSVDSGFGAAYIFARNHGGTNAWGQVKKLRPSDERAQQFGFSVAISGSIAIVGTLSGEAVYLFARDQGGSSNWGQLKSIEHGDVPILGSENVPPIGFGRAVAIAGDTAVVGAPQKAVGEEDGAHVFVRGDGPFNWGRVKVIAGRQSGGGQFGRAVAVFGDTAVVGAPQNALSTGVHDGAAFLFERNRNGANNWGPVGGTKRGATAPSDPDHGASMGCAVAISGDVVIVGAENADDGQKGEGAAFVYARNEGLANNWGLVKRLQASDRQAGAFFGRAVAISEEIAIVGAFRADSTVPRTGAAYVFKRDQGGLENWGEL